MDITNNDQLGQADFDQLIHGLKNDIQLQVLVCAKLRRRLAELGDAECLEIVDQLERLNQQMLEMRFAAKE